MTLTIENFIMFVLKVLITFFIVKNTFAQDISSSSVQTEQRISREFHSLDISGLAVVYLTQGTPQELKVEISGMPMNDIVTKVENGVLIITTLGQHNGELIKVTVITPELKTITVSGAGQLSNVGTFKTGQLKLILNEVAAANLDVDVEKLQIHMNGGDLTIKGKAHFHTITKSVDSSRGKLDIAGLKVGS